jgi:chaperone required for assembly of F1-ATPase
VSDNPLERARNAEPLNRFYTEVGVASREEGYAVLLDGRELRTPARRRLGLPVAPLAEAVAEEWRAQGETIRSDTMPITRLVNSAVDGVADAMDVVRSDIVRFAEADLVCYRAEGPDGLVIAQQEQWDPVIAWARDELAIRLNLAEGLMHIAQPPEVSSSVAAEAARHDPFSLAALHVMTTLTGSSVIALAVSRGRLSAEEAWSAAHVDEDWQIAQWGADSEAMARRDARWRDMAAAARVIALLRR